MAAWDGWPPAADADAAWHWLQADAADAQPQPWMWRPLGFWLLGATRASPADMVRLGHRYLGPCRPPSSPYYCLACRHRR